ncbi:MAG TPA: hypothetical protein VLA67_09695 [Nitrospiraceae bacterium]|nr:hypothetical protein [Nitrospiraceae bacterium]
MKLRQTTRRYVAIWLAVALSMGVALAVAEHRRNALNDPDQAWERTGLLLPAKTYQAPSLGVAPGRPVVVFFARSLSDGYLFHDLADQSDLASMSALVVVTPDGSRPVIQTGIQRFVSDGDGSLAAAAGLHRPIDGGYPVGYALIDSDGYLRFRTLDPGFGQRAWEIKLLLKHLG